MTAAASETTRSTTPAAHRRRRRPRPGTAPAPEGPLRRAARERHRRPRRRRRRRGSGARGLRGRAAVHALLEGMDAVVHLGGISAEGPFEPILQANIVGVYNLYEAARKHGVQAHRVRQLQPRHRLLPAGRSDRRHACRCGPTATTACRKAFGENLSRFYFDRYGIETVCLRIGSSFPEPKDRRMLATWLSYDDLERLVVASLTAPVVGHSIIYGMSDNATTWWDNTPAAPHRLPPAGQLRALPRRPRGARSRAWTPPTRRQLPGRRLRAQGTVRVSPRSARAHPSTSQETSMTRSRRTLLPARLCARRPGHCRPARRTPRP